MGNDEGTEEGEEGEEGKEEGEDGEEDGGEEEEGEGEEAAHEYAWQETGHEWIGRQVARRFGRGALAIGTICRWLPPDDEGGALCHPNPNPPKLQP
jgi:hypothetical protein